MYDEYVILLLSDLYCERVPCTKYHTCVALHGGGCKKYDRKLVQMVSEADVKRCAKDYVLHMKKRNYNYADIMMQLITYADGGNYSPETKETVKRLLFRYGGKIR